jgi:hypothetical protein
MQVGTYEMDLSYGVYAKSRRRITTEWEVTMQTPLEMELVEPATGSELSLLIVIIAAGVVFIVLAVVLMCVCCRRRNS